MFLLFLLIYLFIGVYIVLKYSPETMDTYRKDDSTANLIAVFIVWLSWPFLYSNKK